MSEIQEPHYILLFFNEKCIEHYLVDFEINEKLLFITLKNDSDKCDYMI